MDICIGQMKAIFCDMLEILSRPLLNLMLLLFTLVELQSNMFIYKAVWI